MAEFGVRQPITFMHNNKIMEITINNKTKNQLIELLKQRDQIMQAFESTVKLILDAKDVDYEGQQIDLDLDNNKIVITNGKS